jgi:hypothetical protein
MINYRRKYNAHMYNIMLDCNNIMYAHNIIAVIIIYVDLNISQLDTILC